MVVTKITTLSVLLCALTFLWTMETVYGYTSPYVHGGKPGNPGKRVSKRLKPDFKFKTRRFFFSSLQERNNISVPVDGPCPNSEIVILLKQQLTH